VPWAKLEPQGESLRIRWSYEYIRKDVNNPNRIKST
jgi:hypothetical protein